MFTKPKINTIKPDIKNAYIYFRAVRKWGKTTTWKNIILQKYNGDASKGLLIEVGNEHGTTMLDNINTTHVSSYKDLIQLKDWLIKEKGNEHNIEMLCFDVVDELPEIFDKEIIRLNSTENPNKPCKSIKSCFGGYNAGVEMSANKIKAYMEELKNAGFGIMCIGHTKMKAISDKATTEDEKWMTLTGTLSSNYESAIADVCDIVLTGNIEREFETKGEGDNAKNYLVSEERRLYFRGTELIAAGSRFAPGTVPDYIVFDGSPEEFAAKLIKTIEEGMEKSKTNSKVSTPKKSIKPTPAPTPISESEEDSEVVDEQIDEDFDIFNEEAAAQEEELVVPVDKEVLSAIRGSYRLADADIKAQVKTVLENYGNKLASEMRPSDVGKIKTILGI